MLDNTSKEKTLDKIIELSSRGDGEAETLQQILYELLLTDANGGKLYKYRSCSMRNLSLIETQTLYCSKASDFNDPFDCKIGVDFQSIQDALFGSELKTVIEPLLEKFVLVETGKAKLAELSETDQRGIKALQRNEILNKLRSDPSLKTEDAFQVFVMKNPSVFLSMMTSVLKDAGIKSKVPLTNAQMEAAMSSISELRIDPGSFDAENVSDFLKKQGATSDADQIDLIKEWALFLNNPELISSAEDIDKRLSSTEVKVQKELNDTFCIGSLAADNKNRLMWAHYAENHTGFCIEYDYANAPKGILPMPVLYSHRRPKIPWDIVYDPNPENLKKANKVFMKALLTKDEVWSYEQEWRILIPTAMGRLVKMPPISCIYLGARCSDDNKKLIKIVAERRSVPVKQMTIDRGEYDLHIKE